MRVWAPVVASRPVPAIGKAPAGVSGAIGRRCQPLLNAKLHHLVQVNTGKHAGLLVANYDGGLS